MLKSYLKIAFRNLSRNKFYASINIVGLAVAITCFLVIGMWVRSELSYDRHYPNADRIFRLDGALYTNGVSKPMATTDPRIADTVRAEYPEVAAISRVLNTPTMLAYNGQNTYEKNTYYTDTTFFDVFAFKFVRGNAKAALRKGTIVITESVAKKLFGNEDPLGKTVYFNNIKTNGDTIARTVTGVIVDNDRKSHFHPTIIIPRARYLESFEQVYALFKKGYTPDDFMRRVWAPMYDHFFKRDYREDNQDISMHLTPVRNIHLTPDEWGELEHNGNKATVYIFAIVALFILIVASINYVNLATAASFDRAREISIRKLLGGSKRQLITQLLFESVLIAVLAALLGLSLTEISSSLFADFAGTPFTTDISFGLVIGFAFVLAIVLGVLSGLYPAFYISSRSRIELLHGASASGNRSATRTVLVIAQFAVSYIALVATMVVAAQMKFINKKDLGFDKDNILVINLNDAALKERTEDIKNELKKDKGVIAVSASYSTPGEDPAHSHILYETPAGLKATMINGIWADYDYLKVMGLKLVAGHNFDSSMFPAADTTIFAVLNESAVKAFNWDSPIGKRLQSTATYGVRKGSCIGVVEDFHTGSMHEAIAPTYVLIPKSHSYYIKYNYLSLRVKPEDEERILAYAKRIYRSFSRQYPFEYFFLSDRISKQYDKERQQGTLFNWFAGICLFISCLGLLGLVSFSARQRDLVIAIRKIAGAPESAIVIMLCRDYLAPLIIAFAIAIPISWYAANTWLQGFAYHTSISWTIFVVAGIVALAIALATIIIHTIRAANKDPAFVLRHE